MSNINILNELADFARMRVNESLKRISLDEIRNRAELICDEDFKFERALKKSGLSFICECKKASPSKGLIDPEFNYLQIAKDYEGAGADCISVLTEPNLFLGDDKYLFEISQNVNIPTLRKDFVIDEYMIYEAKILGASGILLICAILDGEKLRDYINICDKLGLSALVEVHDENEIKTALNSGARIIGVNNRNLKNFSVDMNNFIKLGKLIPENILFVSESGVKNSDDVKKIYDAGADGVLIGEILMRAEDKKLKLSELKSKL